MSLFWKTYTIYIDDLQTKDDREFFASIDFEQKRNLYWLTQNNIYLHKCVVDCIRDAFKMYVTFNEMFEGGNPNRLILDTQLNRINCHINNIWELNYQPNLKFGPVKNIKINVLTK